MTYTIPRYPVHLIDVVRVADGTSVTIRPTLPQDVELQREFFRTLSAEGRYCRFMTPLNELPEALAQRFASIDYCSHLALLAEVFEDGLETMIGEARYVVDEHDPATCEFAIAVANGWQARGIARTLLDRLERQAAASSIRAHGRRHAPCQQGDDRARGAHRLRCQGEPRGCSARETGEELDPFGCAATGPAAGRLSQSYHNRRKKMIVKSNNPETMVPHAGASVIPSVCRRAPRPRIKC